MSERTPVCADMRAALLDAEPAELRGEADSPLVRHLRACQGCAAAAHLIMNAHAELSTALSILAPAAGDPGVVPIFRAQQRRRRGLAMASSLAGAAVLVLFVVRERPAEPLARLEPLPAATTISANTPVVNVADGRDVAVLRPTNRNITVVWYLNRE